MRVYNCVEVIIQKAAFNRDVALAWRTRKKSELIWSAGCLTWVIGRTVSSGVPKGRRIAENLKRLSSLLKLCWAGNVQAKARTQEWDMKGWTRHVNCSQNGYSDYPEKEERGWYNYKVKGGGSSLDHILKTIKEPEGRKRRWCKWVKGE